MNEPAAAGEHVVETEPGDPNKALNPHMGEEPAPDGVEEPKPGDGEEPEAEGAAPAPAEDNGDIEPDDDALRRKVGELAFENRQLKRDLDAAREAPEDEAEPEPLKTLKDFDYDEQAFNRYLIEEGAKLGEERAKKAQAKTSHDAEAQRQQDEFAAREAAFDAEHPGFSERLHADDLMISPEMALFIADPASETGLHVGDYLSQNKAEAARIAGLPVTAQAREMVKLEERISGEIAKAKAEKAKTSTAPEPPANPVDGTDPGVGDVNPGDPKSDDLSDDEWLARRNKQLDKRRSK